MLRPLAAAVLAAVLCASPAVAESKKGESKANVITTPEGSPAAEKSAGDGKGGLKAQEIMKVIKANLNQIRKCYETLLIRKPQAEGKVQTHFQISGDTGAVKTVTRESAKLDDARFLGCIDDRIMSWKFPKPRGGQDVQVDYPFVFNPS